MSPRSLPTLAILLTSLAFASAARGEKLLEQRFAPPTNADAKGLLKFIHRLAEPGVEFRSRDDANRYSRRAARAIVKAAGRVLRGEATDAEAIKAIEVKASALRLLDGMNAAEDLPSADEFLGGWLRDKRPAVALAALRSRAADRVQHWRVLGQAEKAQFLTDVESVVTAAPATPDHVRLVTYVADVVGDSPERGEVLTMVERIEPHFANSVAQDGAPEVAEKLASLEGVARRLRLPGEPIEVEGTLLDGEEIDWEQYRGKVVLIDYWATWCGLCHAELPTIRQLHQTYAEQGLEVLGVSLDEDPERVEKFLAEQDIPWPTLFGGSQETRGWNHPMVAKYGIHDLPRLILVDRDGKVVTLNARGGQLAAEVKRLFADAAQAEPATETGGDDRLAIDDPGR